MSKSTKLDELEKKITHNTEISKKRTELENEAINLFSEDYPDLDRYNEKLKEVDNYQYL